MYKYYEFSEYIVLNLHLAVNNLKEKHLFKPVPCWKGFFLFSIKQVEKNDTGVKKKFLNRLLSVVVLFEKTFIELIYQYQRI